MKPNQNTSMQNATSVPTSTGVSNMSSTSLNMPDKSVESSKLGSDVAFQSKSKKSHGMLYGMILLAILAAGGIGFGVWAMLDANGQVAKKDEQIAELREQLAEKSEMVADDDTTIVDVEVGDDNNTGASSNSADYIYIGGWGLKIGIPEEVNKISYLVDYRASEQDEDYLYINGVVGGSEGIPSFLNTPTEEYWLGGLHRLVQGREPALRASMGTLVTTIDGYEYYYSHPQAIRSTNEQDYELELKTVDSIQRMLTDANNFSKI